MVKGRVNYSQSLTQMKIRRRRKNVITARRKVILNPSAVSLKQIRQQSWSQRENQKRRIEIYQQR